MLIRAMSTQTGSLVLWLMNNKNRIFICWTNCSEFPAPRQALSLQIYLMGSVFSILLSLSSAWAQEEATNSKEPLDTFRPYVRADYGYDSNLFRLENDDQARALLGTTDKSETYHTLAAGMNVDWRLSRQVVKAKMEANQTRYDTYKQLDYSGHAGLLQWDWLTGKYAKGDVGASETKTQANFSDIQSPTKNLLTTRQAYAHSGIKLALPWQWNLGFVRTTTSNSADSQKTLNYNENKYSTGLQYVTDKGMAIEASSQYSEGKYPNRQIVGAAPVDNGYRQYDNGLSTVWAPSFKTTLKAQINYTQRRYADVPQRNFSGVTGKATTDWAVTEKTNLNLSIYRDIGVVENNTASYTLNRGAELNAHWRPTMKLAFHARALRERQSYEGDPGFILTSAPTREDNITDYQLETRYQVLRKTKLGLVLEHGVRHSNQALAGYHFSSAMLNVRSEF